MWVVRHYSRLVDLRRVGANYRLHKPPVVLQQPSLLCSSAGEPELFGKEDSAVQPPSGMAAGPESDPEMTDMLSQAAMKLGLRWKPPPHPEPSRILRVVCTGS